MAGGQCLKHIASLLLGDRPNRDSTNSFLPDEMKEQYDCLHFLDTSRNSGRGERESQEENEEAEKEEVLP